MTTSCGFVVPNSGGDRAFVHAKTFQPGLRRLVDGDLISHAATERRSSKLAGECLINLPAMAHSVRFGSA